MQSYTAFRDFPGYRRATTVVLFAAGLNGAYTEKSYIPKPFGVRAMILLRELVATLGPLALLVLPRENFCRCASASRSLVSMKVLCLYFLDHVESGQCHVGAIPVYTNGFKSKNRVGWAVDF